MTSSLRLWPLSHSYHGYCKTRLRFDRTLKLLTTPNTIPFFCAMFQQNKNLSANCFNASTSLFTHSPLSGLEDDLVGYVFGKKKATEVAHLVWKHVLRKGDTAVDATCGNGYDSLAMLKMVADESGTGCVYGLDIQREALQSTSCLLDETVSQAEKRRVKLFNMCHSRMEEAVAKDTPVRLVAFNLGYLPGGDKNIITKAETTLLALQAAERIVIPGGLISMVVYVGHPGGREGNVVEDALTNMDLLFPRFQFSTVAQPLPHIQKELCHDSWKLEELETVEAFASGLSVDDWICCKFQMLNRPFAPVPIFLFKR